MSKRFIFTQPIDFELKRPDFIVRNEYPQQYLKEILQARVPDAQVIIMDDHHDVVSLLNDALKNGEEEFQKYRAAYQDAMSMAVELDVLDFPSAASDFERKEYHHRREQHRQRVKEKYPEYSVNLAYDCFTYAHPRKISSFTESKIKTDIEGIVVPIGHGDYRDITDILCGLNGTIKKQFDEIVANRGLPEKESDTLENSNVKHNLSLMRQHFYKRFQIPVFESFIHAPYDRDGLAPVGRQIDWKEDEYSFGREEHIKFAFNKWIDTYFPKK
ncbi:hypothetical protein K9M74_00035 [Candidatus Woesearchaeota archaeon]|nr:hypothetical protein [Candidatus Woesearchaeota archaeon]